MTSVVNADIALKDVVVQEVSSDDFIGLGMVQGRPTVKFDEISFRAYEPGFHRVVGPRPQYSLLLTSATTSKNPFFYSACIYLQEHDEIYATSNLLSSSNSSALPSILISRVILKRDAAGAAVRSAEWQKLRPPSNLPMPAGGVPYKQGMLLCAQGIVTSVSHATSSGLFYMPRNKPPEPILVSFYGRPYNSVRDVAVAPDDGSLWFTDPCGGHDQGFRQPPKLPCQVYRNDPATKVTRAMTDELKRPGGIAFSPDGGVLYVTDTDAFHGSEDIDLTRAASIYAFDVIRRSGGPFITGKRLFAHAQHGIPAAIKCDTEGRLYAACGRGIEVWAPSGVMLGLIETPEAASSLCFGRAGELFICGGKSLWRVQLSHPDVDEKM